MERQNPYIDLSGVRETSSSSPDYAAYHNDAPPHSGDTEDGAPSYTQAPPRRSTTGSPRHSFSNGYSNDTSARPSTVTTRRASGMGPGAVIATPGGVPLRRRDSIKHPYSLHLAASGDNAANLDGTQAESTEDSSGNNNKDSQHAGGGYLFRASAHGRRHSAAVAVLNRDDADAAAPPVNTTVSASPDRPAAAAPAVAPAVATATTQEDVKRYVATVMADHAATLGTWEQRVAVAEIYRDKPLRTGGLPAALRTQDRAFLERVATGLKAHLQQLEDARSLLLQTRQSVPPTRAGGRGDLNAWDEYCSCYEQTLVDLTSEAAQMRKRVERLLREGGRQDGVRTHRPRAGSLPQSGSHRGSRARSQGSVASRRDSPQATPRGERPALVAEGRAGSNAPAPPAAPHTGDTDAAVVDRHPHVPQLSGGNAGAVQRGSHAIRPGHHGESATRASPVPESQPSWTRASSLHNPLRPSVSSARSLTSSRSQQHARALHPDTVVRLDVPTSSPNDLQSPYGRLMSPKRGSSPLRDPSHAVLVVPPPADVVAELQEQQQQHEEDLLVEEEEAEAAAEVPVTARSSRASRASRGSRASRTSRAVSSSVNPTIEVPPQLRTYSSPRGTARAASPGSGRGGSSAAAAATPALPPLRRRQLLEVIEHYERHSATLQRGDLHRARECFYELYGEQQGLRQYCLWIDDIALSALRVPQNSS